MSHIDLNKFKLKIEIKENTNRRSIMKVIQIQTEHSLAQNQKYSALSENKPSNDNQAN